MEATLLRDAVSTSQLRSQVNQLAATSAAMVLAENYNVSPEASAVKAAMTASFQKSSSVLWDSCCVSANCWQPRTRALAMREAAAAAFNTLAGAWNALRFASSTLLSVVSLGRPSLSVGRMEGYPRAATGASTNGILPSEVSELGGGPVCISALGGVGPLHVYDLPVPCREDEPWEFFLGRERTEADSHPPPPDVDRWDFWGRSPWSSSILITQWKRPGNSSGANK